MKKETTATFIGHKDCYGLDREQLRWAISSLIENNGVTDFISGGMGSFDIICAGFVKELQIKYPYVRSYVVVPMLSYAKKYSEYYSDYYDGSMFPEELDMTPYAAAIPKRNRYLVDSSAYAICFVHHISGGSYKTMEYAKKRDIRIININQITQKSPP